MTNEQKLDYMIQSLELAKEEILYAKDWIEKYKTDPDFFQYGHFRQGKRNPNGTLIRESLKMVGRMANIVANEVVLSPYSYEVFKTNES